MTVAAGAAAARSRDAADKEDKEDKEVTTLGDDGFARAVPEFAWRTMPWTFNWVALPAAAHKEPEQMTDEWRKILVGEPAVNRRASAVYLTVGLVLSAVSLWGFTPAVYWRIQTGQWWRDPVNIRSMPLPPSLDPVICFHGVTGICWLLCLATMILTGAAFSGDGADGAGCGLRRHMRALHVWMGNRSLIPAMGFFASCMLTLVGGLFSEPIGQGYNTLFVRAVQFCAVACSALLYYLGLLQGLRRTLAMHKDCMIGSALFAMIPTGLPRFGRDLLQWLIGERCNVSTGADFWFFWCCIYSILGWPALYLLSKRWSVHEVFPVLLKTNVVLLVGLCIVGRPSLKLDPCLWEAAEGLL